MFHLITFGACIVSIVISASLGSAVLLAGAVALFVLVMCGLAVISMRAGGDLSFFLLVPVAMSVLQNIYLAPVSSRMPADAFQLVIVANVIYSFTLCAALVALSPPAASVELRRLRRRVGTIFSMVFAYGTFTLLVFGNNITSGLASARNILSPMLFLMIGLLAASVVDFEYFLRLVLVLGAVALALAGIEYLIPGFWIAIGLPALWELKGIPVTVGSQLPSNFYASEQIVAGEFIRRMAGPFADPVNFGTFLFALSMVSWYCRSRVLNVLSLASIVLTVSKGALLGLLTFVAVWANKVRSRFEFVLALIVVALASAYFYGFTQSSSTGSTSAHINGLLAAFVELPQHPLGRGLGSTGVLAGLFVDEAAEGGSSITESGLGMIIGQLGIPGLVAYMVLFTSVIGLVRRIADTRRCVLGMSLVMSFVLNCLFNEVALSPNSSALYFLIVGILIGTSYMGDGAARAGDSTQAAWLGRSRRSCMS